MAIQVRSTSSSVVGVNVELGTTDSLIVLSGVTLSSMGDNAVQGTGSKHIVTLQGAVLATGNAIRIGSSGSSTFGEVVHIKATGAAVCASSASNGVIIFGHDSAVYNEGVIQGEDGVEMQGVGGVGRIQNSGTIQGTESGIVSVGSQVIEIINSGVIAGDQNSLTITNGGVLGISTADITNIGHMIGDIVLNINDDVYQGRSGHLVGTIFGGGGNDTIETGVDNDFINGGTGADIMVGWKGNDSYTVDNIGDLVDEGVAGSNGVDLVNSSVNISLVTVANAAVAKGIVENIILEGSGNIFAYGNSVANTLIGNDNSNVLAGGLGNDALIGSGDNDFFLFNTVLNATTNVDTISDMNGTGNDTIRLENAIFTALTTTGVLAAAAFRIGAAAADADDRIIYNSVNGDLIYDSNGNAAGGATLFARLGTGLALTAADFVVV